MNILVGIIVFIIGACLGEALSNLIEDDYNTSMFKFKICCPHCKHKFSFIESVPIFSYILSDGKCKYCGKNVGIKVLLSEFMTAILFTLGFFSLGIDVRTIQLNQAIKIIEFSCMFATIMLIGNIDLKRHKINKKVLLFGIITQAIVCLYYYCTKQMTNIFYYRYILCLLMVVCLFALDIIYQKRIAEDSYVIDIILFLTYIISSIEYEIFIIVLINTLVLSLFNLLFNRVDYIKNDSSDILKEVEQKKISVGFWISINTILICIVENYLINVL